MSQGLNYEKLLFKQKINFKKNNDNLTISLSSLDKNDKKDILDFVNDLNNKNIDYEKKDDTLIIPTSKTPINNPMIKLYNELTSLNKLHKIFYGVYLKKDSFDIHVNNQKGMFCYVKFVDNYFVVSYLSSNCYKNKTLKILCDNHNTKIPFLIYIAICMIKTNNLNIYENCIETENLTLTYLGENMWSYNSLYDDEEECDTETLLTKIYL